MNPPDAQRGGSPASVSNGTQSLADILELAQHLNREYDTHTNGYRESAGGRSIPSAYLIAGASSLSTPRETKFGHSGLLYNREIVAGNLRMPVLKKGVLPMNHNRNLIELIAAMALAAVATTSAFAQMGGGGMMGGFGAGGGHGMGMMGGNGTGSRSDNAYGPGTNGLRRDAVPAPEATGAEPPDDLDLGPLDQLNLSTRQLGEISIIRAEFGDRQSNARRRLKAEQAKLRELYDAPERDQAKIDKRFRRIERLRREIFESWVNAHDRIAAQLSAQQRQRMKRIAPRWYAGG